METVKFSSANEIYEELDSDIDLYCVDEGIYMFKYNEVGAIAYYYLSMDELIAAAKNADGYIGSALGPGGYILDVALKLPDGEIIDYEDPDFDEYYDDPNSEIDITDICDFLNRFVGKDFIYADVEELAPYDE